jgi:transcriptional regulator with XRE-family HTH domain
MIKMSKPELNDDNALDARIAGNVKAQRHKCGLTIEALAQKSGISRAMISKIERGEASPTAVLLARLTNAMGITLSQVFNVEAEHSPLVRATERSVWRDPATGYLRRNVASSAAPVDIVDVTLPAGARVEHDNSVPLNLTQIVWILEGSLMMRVDQIEHDLSPGDSLAMRLDRPISFHNQTHASTRYAVILVKG